MRKNTKINLKYKKLFERGFIGSLELKNRIIFPACSTNFGSPFGEVTDKMIDYYKERAKGGAGLIIVENACVDYPRGKNSVREIRCDEERFIAGLNELAETIRNEDAKVFLQLHHAGRQTQLKYTQGIKPVAPSVIPCWFLPEARELEIKEIKEIEEKFIRGAVIAKLSGFDGIELHGAHGYLFAQFMSPYTNKREDEYSYKENFGTKFATEVIKGIKKELPGYPIIFRISGDEFYENARTLEETKKIAPLLQSAGCDAINVSCGIYECMPKIIEPMPYKEGWRVYLAEEIKKVVSIPVITVGVIKTPDLAEKILNKGQADFIAIGRGLIADAQWPKKAKEGREDEIRRCISCNTCFGRIYDDKTLRCAINATVGRERETSLIKKARVKKEVMIIGGGPAGMESARICRERGHKVTLYEKENRLGGQLNLANLPPGREKIEYLIEYLKNELKRVKVKIRLNTEVNEKLIKDKNPQVVILATGAEPLIPDIPGIEGKNVFSAWEILKGKMFIENKKVVIAGGGMVGCETALYLAEKNNEVTVVEMLGMIAGDIDPLTQTDLLEKLAELNVKSKVYSKIVKIDDKGVVVVDRNLKEKRVEAEVVVLALGAKSNNKLKEKFLDDEKVTVQPIAPKEIYIIGDAKNPGKIIDAIHQGFYVGLKV